MQKTWLLAAVALSCLGSCRTPGRDGPTSQPAPEGPPPTQARLAERAAQLWNARAQDDCAAVFEFETTESRGDATAATFCDWYRANEQFVVHSFRMGRVVTEGPMGWVEVFHSCSVRKFPKLPPRDVRTEERWYFVDGDWYPVPDRKAEGYPVAPWHRDPASEAALRGRFDESWAARQQGDVATLVNLVDPRDREDELTKELERREKLYAFQACEIRWLQAVGDSGKVAVVYTAKLTDPNQRKRPPEPIAVLEHWVRYEGQWYRDIILQRPGAASESEAQQP